MTELEGAVETMDRVAHISPASRVIKHPQKRLIHELFEEQVERTPDALALRCAEQSLTYAELNAKANQLARYLVAREIGPDKLVGVCLERTPEMLVSILGVWKAGGAYVPLNPQYPPERVAYILKDAAPQVVLTQRGLKSCMPLGTMPCIAMDAECEEIAKQDDTNLDSSALGITERHLAYVIYTSGSTGEPNGVMVEHRNIVSYWPVVRGLYRYPLESVRIALNAPFTFDVSIQQFILLLSGCTLFVVSDELRQEPQKLVQFLQSNRIEAVDCTPTQLNVWLTAGLLEKSGQSLRTLIVGGEAMDESLWTRLTECSSVDCYNVYGPTECTVFCTTAYLRGALAAPHIGRPTENAHLHILDAQLRPVPIGVTGEIHIGGSGVSRGYLNQPELTAARFIANPFSEDSPARLYRTGDLGRWRIDGNIEYVGRNDHQVKVRGFRIEPGEIETRIRRHAQIADAVVVVREDSAGEKRLVAYVIPRDPLSFEGPLSTDDLRTSLSAALPDYMVPSAFVVLQSFPLTPNGKLDRNALPCPETRRCTGAPYEVPQGETEETLAAIWKDVLRVENIGRHDNFLALGGQSMLGMRLLMNLVTRFPIEMTFPDIGQHPTIRQMAEFVEAQLRSVDGKSK